MCRIVDCPKAKEVDEIGVVIKCDFYPTLKSLPTDCRVCDILNDKKETN